MRKRNIKPIILTVALALFVVAGGVTSLSLAFFGAAEDVAPVASTLTYDQTYSDLERFFTENGALGADGLIEVPTGDGTITPKTLEEVTNDFLATGELSYTKGIREQYMDYLVDTIDLDIFEKQISEGGSGWDASAYLDSSIIDNAIGDTCLNGDINGDSFVDGVDLAVLFNHTSFLDEIAAIPPPGCVALADATGYITAVDPIFEVNGGTLSMKPCAVDQVLVTGASSTWECATVSSGGGVDTNTTNVSAALALTGTELVASITDSAGATINAPALDLGTTFVSNTSLTTMLEDYATEADLTALTGRVTTLETNAANYLTNNALDNYYTETEVDTALSLKQNKLPDCADNQLIKYALATATWVCSDASSTDLTGYATESWVETKNYVTTTALDTAIADFTTETEVNTAITTAGANYVLKADLNCSANQAVIGSGTNGTIDCRAIQDITSGTVTANNNLITSNTLATVLGNYYMKAEIDAMNLVTGDRTGGYQIQVVNAMPGTPDAGVIYFVRTQP